MIKRFGKLITASFIVMAAGIVTFLLVFPLYAMFGFDTDVLGLIILDLGLVLFILGIILRKKLRGFKLAVLIILDAVLSLPVMITVIALIYFLATGRLFGD